MQKKVSGGRSHMSRSLERSSSTPSHHQHVRSLSQPDHGRTERAWKQEHSKLHGTKSSAMSPHHHHHHGKDRHMSPLRGGGSSVNKPKATTNRTVDKGSHNPRPVSTPAAVHSASKLAKSPHHNGSALTNSGGGGGKARNGPESTPASGGGSGAIGNKVLILCWPVLSLLLHLPL